MSTPAQQLARELRTLRREVSAISRASQMSRRSIDGGGLAIYDNDGTLRGTLGVQADGTTAVVTVNDPAPTAPTAPIVEPTAGGLAISWDGTFADDLAQRSDFRRVDVYTREASLPVEDAVVRASLMAAGSVTLTFPPDAYTVHFVTVTTGGATSPASISATETPAPSGGDGTDQAARDAAAAAQADADAAAAAAAAAAAQAQAAQDAADSAVSDAADALSSASTAQSTADTAQTAASTAQSAADTAQTAANAKVRYITAASAPTYSGPADSAVWRDSANGYRLNRWNGTDWDVVQFGGNAIQAGAITAALLSATAIDGKTITGATLRTAASGQRIQIDSANGLIGYDGFGAARTQVTPGGALIANSATLNSASINGTFATVSPLGSNARVEIAQQLALGGTGSVDYGYIQFRTPNVNESPAVLSVQTNTAGGDGRKIVTLDAGIDGKTQTTGANLSMTIEDAPTTGNRSVLRLNADALIFSRAVENLVPKTTFAVADYPNSTFFGPWGVPTDYNDAYYEVDANGYVHLGGLLKCKTAGTWAMGTVVFVLPPSCRPLRQHLVPVMTGQSAYGHMGYQIAPNGNVTHVGNMPGWSYVASGWVSLDGVSFRAGE